MDLWIRSQDKTKLMKANEIEICQNPTGTWWFNVGQCVGEYKTKERALEVLDEIQKILMPKIQVTSEFKKSNLTGNCNWIDKKEIMQFNTYVYEMPKEQKVSKL